jgi:purine-binding chemotaxis protein CheW
MMASSNNSNAPALGATSGVSLFGARQRAAAAAAAAAIDRATLVAFSIGDVMFAVPVESVERILRYAVPSPSSGAGAPYVGTIDYRSKSLAVLDLRQKFGRSDLKTGESTRTVVFNTQPEWIAAIVDGVSEVITVDAATIATPEPGARGYLLGSVQYRDRKLLVLDIGKTFASTETLSLETIGVDVDSVTVARAE